MLALSLSDKFCCFGIFVFVFNRFQFSRFSFILVFLIFSFQFQFSLTSSLFSHFSPFSISLTKITLSQLMSVTHCQVFLKTGSVSTRQSSQLVVQLRPYLALVFVSIFVYVCVSMSASLYSYIQCFVIDGLTSCRTFCLLLIPLLQSEFWSCSPPGPGFGHELQSV